ncbi:hypothetical protein AVEN_132021-1 [Araneus ventricosus]|uniref:ATP-dependent DNA helicase n=1 Tax=Araneus ventricosus TaxID=182803 RepID=A0A4Y2B291_ARAVE|nr:hypothetical protein AVEN_132021-1 [Araneus ventricosus]
MARVLHEDKVILWDVCTMDHKRGIEALNRALLGIRDHNQLIGGVTVLLDGDCRHALLIVPRDTHVNNVKACLKSSILWSNAKILSLRINMRFVLQRDLRAK